MGNISEFIRQRDLEGHHNEVYFAGKGSYKSRTGGCVSLCFIAIVLVIIYFKVVDELQKNHIKVNTEIVKNDFTKIQLDYKSMSFRIQDTNTHKNINKSQLPDYGVNITIQKHYIHETQTSEEIELVQCENGIDFCIPQNYNFSLFGRTDVYLPNTEYQRIAIKLKTCYKASDPNCQNYKDNLILFLLMENNIILPSKSKIEDTVTNELRFFQLHGKLILSQIIGQYFDIKKVYIKQDSSVLPEMIHEDDYKDQKESWFYDEETSQEIYINPNTTGDHNDLMKIFFKRSLYTHTYDRSYPKLDNMLAQIFGLTGFFSIMFILYRGYNQWSYNQWKLQKLGLPHERRNIFSYYKHKIKCEEDKQVYGMDIFDLIRRLQYLEKVVKKQNRLESFQARQQFMREETNNINSKIDLEQEILPNRYSLN